MVNTMKMESMTNGCNAGRSRGYSASTEERVNSYPSRAHEAITTRIRNLEKETDLQTACSLAAGAISLLTIAARSRAARWVLLGLAVPLFCYGKRPKRRFVSKDLLALRSRATIDSEIFALQIIRGDFDDIRNELHRRACAMKVLKNTPASRC